MTKFNILAAISLLAFTSSAAFAANSVPFKGSAATTQTGVVQGGLLIVEGSGTGNANQLGRFAITFNEEVDLSTGIGVGTYTFVAANGDSLTATFIGNAEPTADPSILLLHEFCTITGGTGRFSGATGTFALERVFNLGTGTSTASLNGTISNPGRR